MSIYDLRLNGRSSSGAGDAYSDINCIAAEYYYNDVVNNSALRVS
jgi:hypothetical protein